MKNPWINYIVLRVGLFAVLLTIMLLASFPPILATLFAAAISLSISLLFFGKQRSSVSEAIARSVENRRKNVSDTDSAVEDDAVDSTKK